jgi:hypothetical protein
MKKKYDRDVRNNLKAIHQFAETALCAIEAGEAAAAKGWIKSILLSTDLGAINGGARKMKQLHGIVSADAREERKRKKILSFYREGDSAQDVLRKMELAGKSAELKTILKIIFS